MAHCYRPSADLNSPPDHEPLDAARASPVPMATAPPCLTPPDHPLTVPRTVSQPAPTGSRRPRAPTAPAPYPLCAVALSRRESPFASLLLAIELLPLCSGCRGCSTAPRAPRSSPAPSHPPRVFPAGRAASLTNGLSSHGHSCWKSVARCHVRGTRRCPAPPAMSKHHLRLLEFPTGTS
jgi:hypothetical protein